MPKRSTQTYSSEDAPQTDDDVITVYYCKYSGDPVLITDAVLGNLPKRRTDGARVLYTEKYTVRLKAQAEVKAKLIKREGGKLEKQYRYLMGDLPVCYRSEPEGKYLYLIDGALSAFNFGNAAGEGGETPVPPCIQQTASGMIQIAIDIEDKARTKAVSKITADEVGVALTVPVAQADDELLEFLGKVLHLRLPQMSLLRGWSTRSKLLMVQGLSATQVYERLHESMEQNRKRIERLVNLHSADNKWVNKPELRSSSPSTRSWRSRSCAPKMTWNRTISSGSRVERRSTGIRSRRRSADLRTFTRPRARRRGPPGTTPEKSR